jgi:hypothetical protein
MLNCADVQNGGKWVRTSIKRAGSCTGPRFRYARPRMNCDWKFEFRNVWDRIIAAWRTGRNSTRGRAKG